MADCRDDRLGASLPDSSAPGRLGRHLDDILSGWPDGWVSERADSGANGWLAGNLTYAPRARNRRPCVRGCQSLDPTWLCARMPNILVYICCARGECVCARVPANLCSMCIACAGNAPLRAQVPKFSAHMRCARAGNPSLRARKPTLSFHIGPG